VHTHHCSVVWCHHRLQHHQQAPPYVSNDLPILLLYSLTHSLTHSLTDSSTVRCHTLPHYPCCS
jgi:hypothetical protein